MRIALSIALLVPAGCGLMSNRPDDSPAAAPPVVIDDPLVDEPAVPRPIIPDPTLTPSVKPSVYEAAPEIVKGNGGSQDVSVPPTPPLPARPSTFDEVVEILREIAARNPNSKFDQVALAVALALKDSYPQALKMVPEGEKAFTHTDLFTRLLRVYLHEQLGEHSKAQSSLREIDDEIERREGVKVEKAVLTSKVNGFQDYVASPTNAVDVSKQVELYVQICNFALKQEKDDFIMHLRYNWELFDDTNKARYVDAWAKAPLEAREDRLIKKGKTREFFQVFRLKVPYLPAGKYTLRITVDDLMADKKRDAVDIPIQINDYFPPNK